MKTRLVVVIIATAVLFFAGGCSDDDNDEPGMPNPAAVFCEEQGGTTSGPEPMCQLPDGSVVDAWEFFRSEHPDG
jgi:putative hemolysin